MPKIDPAAATVRVGTGYPAPFDAPVAGRESTRLGDVAGLSQFGVNRLRLPPDTWSSQRHWHAAQDEFVYVLAGEVVLVTDAGETVLRAGECAGFPAGDGDGHHLQNRSREDALVLEVGTRVSPDQVHYSDVDMHLPDAPGGRRYVRKDGTSFP